MVNFCMLSTHTLRDFPWLPLPSSCFGWFMRWLWRDYLNPLSWWCSSLDECRNRSFIDVLFTIWISQYDLKFERSFLIQYSPKIIIHIAAYCVEAHVPLHIFVLVSTFESLRSASVEWWSEERIFESLWIFDHLTTTKEISSRFWRWGYHRCKLFSWNNFMISLRLMLLLLMIFIQEMTCKATLCDVTWLKQPYLQSQYRHW